DHAFGDHVATHDAAEDVHQNRLHIGILQHDLEGFGHLLGRGATADVQEVGRFAAEQLDGVHSGHRQTRAVHQAADVAVQLNIGKVELAGFDLCGVFLVQIAVGYDFRMTEQGVRVEVELCIERNDVAAAGQDERVDLG